MAYPPSTLATNATDTTAQLGHHAPNHNSANAAINDIVAELGSNPSGASATVQARFEALGSGLGGPELDLRDYGVLADNNPASAGTNNTAFANAIADLQVSLHGEIGGTIKIPRGVMYVSQTVLVKNKVRIHGQGSRISRIKAVSGFSDTTNDAETVSNINVLCELGNGDGNRLSFAFDSRVEDLCLDCNNVSGLYGLYSQQANELSGGRNVLVVGFNGTGVYFSTGSSGIDFGPAEVYGELGSGVNGICRLLGWNFGLIHEVTASGNNGAPAAGSAGFVFANGLPIWTGLNLHSEGVDEVARVETGAFATLINLLGHSTVLRVVQINSGGRAKVFNARPGNAGSPTVIRDQNTGGQTLTTNSVVEYIAPNNRPTITGSRAAMTTALVQLIDMLKAKGEINDTTTA